MKIFPMETKKYKCVIFDFDGVIVDSNIIREKGFREVLKDYDRVDVEQLLKYHRKNGGLSRYEKFRYFFEDILNQLVRKSVINQLAENFSVIMKREMVNDKILIPETIKFIRNIYGKILLHMVSGSDHNELLFLCKMLKIDNYFKSISGSPTPKTELLRNLMNRFGYVAEEVMLIGDSINDYEAAFQNNIDFYGYNNKYLKGVGAGYIDSMNNLDLNL